MTIWLRQNLLVRIMDLVNTHTVHFLCFFSFCEVEMLCWSGSCDGSRHLFPSSSVLNTLLLNQFQYWCYCRHSSLLIYISLRLFPPTSLSFFPQMDSSLCRSEQVHTLCRVLLSGFLIPRAGYNQLEPCWVVTQITRGG